MPDTNTSPLRALRLPAVLERTALSRTRLFELVKAGRFPTPVKLGNSTINVWADDEIDAWLRAQFARN
jgi:prophage regulatory protein